MNTLNFDIPSHNFAFLTDKIAKLNKKATKLGCELISCDAMFPFSKNVGTDSAPKFIEFLKVVITGAAPVIAGWSFIGKRDPVDGTKSVLVKSISGSVVPETFYDDHALRCDHCKKNARRSFTYLVQKDQETIEVGKTCLKDFLGHANPEKYAEYAESLMDLASTDYNSPNFSAGGKEVLTAEIVDVVSRAIARINAVGFVSRKYSDEFKMSTAQSLDEHFSYVDGSYITCTSDNTESAKLAIDFLVNHPKAKSEEFWVNISKIANADYVSFKNFGYLCAGVNNYMKSIVVPADNFDQTPIAPIEQKVEIFGQVLTAYAYETAFGTKHIFTIKTDTNKLIKMFTCSGRDVEKDSRVCIKGKIGSFEVDSYDRSPFKGQYMTTMAPRTKIILA